MHSAYGTGGVNWKFGDSNDLVAPIGVVECGVQKTSLLFDVHRIFRAESERRPRFEDGADGRLTINV